MPSASLKLESLPLEKPVRVEHAGQAAVVIRTATDVRAYEDSCPHAQWRLSDGEIVDGVLECPGHGWEFNVDTGLCASVPSYCLKPLAVTVHRDVVSVKWSDETSTPSAAAAAPDHARI